MKWKESEIGINFFLGALGYLSKQKKGMIKCLFEEIKKYHLGFVLLEIECSCILAHSLTSNSVILRLDKLGGICFIILY